MYDGWPKLPRSAWSKAVCRDRIKVKRTEVAGRTGRGNRQLREKRKEKRILAMASGARADTALFNSFANNAASR